MSIRPLDNNFHVTGQIQPSQMSELAAKGYRVVVCLRPDGEGFMQPSFGEMEQAAQETGLKLYYMPARPGAVSPQQASQLRQIMRETEGPILAYCASGNRATMAYEMAKNAG